MLPGSLRRQNPMFWLGRDNSRSMPLKLIVCHCLQFCASMWTKEESDQILEIARGIVPKLKTYVVPRGMQVAIGPDATVDHVISKLDEIIHQDV